MTLCARFIYSPNIVFDEIISSMEKKCFDFDGYKDFVRSWISSQPNRGRGLYRKLAEHLRIHSTMMSHIIGGAQHFTEDQALSLSEYMGLSEIETEYFLELLRLERAGTHKLKDRIRKRLKNLRDQSQDIKNRIVAHHQLKPEDSARFYSNWHYSALRLLTDIPEFQTRARLVEALNLPREIVNDAITFLLERGLIVEEAGRLKIGPSRTHLPADSPYIWNLHKNWRLKAVERHGRPAVTELFYTAPMSISAADISKIRELLVQSISEITKIAGESKPEKLVSLNIDWFDVTS
jgi:plasmid maintenance system antidote protein VapI